MHIKEIDFENGTFIDDDGTEHIIPDGCLSLTKEEMQMQIDSSEKLIRKFISDNNYGEIIES